MDLVTVEFVYKCTFMFCIESVSYSALNCVDVQQTSHQVNLFLSVVDFTTCPAINRYGRQSKHFPDRNPIGADILDFVIVSNVLRNHSIRTQGTLHIRSQLRYTNDTWSLRSGRN
jgi:hypothetical protein